MNDNRLEGASILIGLLVGFLLAVFGTFVRPDSVATGCPPDCVQCRLCACSSPCAPSMEPTKTPEPDGNGPVPKPAEMDGFVFLDLDGDGKRSGAGEAGQPSVPVEFSLGGSVIASATSEPAGGSHGMGYYYFHSPVDGPDYTVNQHVSGQLAGPPSNPAQGLAVFGSDPPIRVNIPITPTP